jgi:aryl-alcohol dehydrogenase-like predicted oxidoreductase
MTTNPTATLGAHTVNRIGFGAMQLAGPGVFGPPRDPDGARAVLRRAVELGVDHIDTSQYYGPDVVNELIREALAPYPPGLRIVSKVGGRRDDAGAWLPAQRPEELRAGVEDNLATLGVESLAAVNLRLMDAEPSGAAPLVPLAEQLGTMEDLRREGKIEAIGISSAERATVEEALDLVDLACVQNAFSIVQRDAQDVLDLCAERGIAFVPFFPLGSAFTGGPGTIAADPTVGHVAAKHGVSSAQVALAWLLHRDPHILVIAGTSSIGHLEENLAAATIALDDEDMAALEHVRQVGNPLEVVDDQPRQAAL